MKFDGQSAVEVHTKSNLEELKSFTSMSLYIRVPSSSELGQSAKQDRFIMYLGNKNVSSPTQANVIFKASKNIDVHRESVSVILIQLNGLNKAFCL